VTPGCHREAVLFIKENNTVFPHNLESAIVFQRVVQFLQKSGTLFYSNNFNLDDNLIFGNNNDIHKRLLDMYENLAYKTRFKDPSQNRAMHLNNSIFTIKNKKYLNRYHKGICGEYFLDDINCMLTLKNLHCVQHINSERRNSIRAMQLVFLLAMIYIIYNSLFNEPDLQSQKQFRPG
jgi:hypothetical protein